MSINFLKYSKMKTLGLLSPKALSGALLMIGFTAQSFAQEVIFKAKIFKEEVPTVIFEDVAEDFADYQFFEAYSIPIDFIEEDFIVETDKLGTGNYGSYEIKLQKGNDKLTAYYNKDGHLIYSMEKEVNVLLPPPVRNVIAKEYKGWTITKDIYKMKHKAGKKENIRYKIYLMKGRNKIKIYTDENGKIL